MRKVKWGVMGTADIAQGATIPGMLLAENCELYAIAGRSLEKAQSFQKRFGFEKAYGSYDELLNDPAVEAVYVPLPNNLHCEWSIRAMEAGKHVLCEKPLAVSEAQVREMFSAAEKNGVLLMEAFAYLHSPFVRAVKEEIEKGTIGDVCYLESAFVAGRRPDTDIRLRRETYGGAMYDLGCYPLSLILWMMGKEPATVQACAQFSDQHIDLFTTALLTFDGGAMAALDCGMLIPARLDRHRIVGTKGIIASDAEFNQSGQLSYTISAGGKKETRFASSRNNYAMEVEQFGKCVLGEAVPHISREFSLLTARVTDRILAAEGY